ALAVAGQQHGLVTLDAAGRPVRPAILWNDVRAAGQAARLVAALGPAEWATRTGTRPGARPTPPKWARLRQHQPAPPAAPPAGPLPPDYLTERLTGRPATDRGDASGTGWFGTGSGRYDETVLGRPEIGLDPALRPPVLGPDQPAGEVT